MAYQDELLAAFIGQYGRMCGTVAHELAQGADIAAVAAAAKGKKEPSDPDLHEIRSQRVGTEAALQRALDGHVSMLDVAIAVNRVRDAIESEWLLTLPRFADVPEAVQ